MEAVGDDLKAWASEMIQGILYPEPGEYVMEGIAGRHNEKASKEKA